MGHRFAELAFTPRVQQAQEAAGSRANYARLHGGPDFNDVLGPDEEQFLAARDSLYLATVGETGWPYVQHRGGPPGFVKVLDERTIGFADFRGNRQYVSVGNLAGDQRIALIAVDYPRRRRLKLLGHARIVTADAEPALLERLRTPAYRARVERGIVVTIAGFDWNCPQHITPRYTEAEIAAATQPLRDRIAQLEVELQSARARLAER
jgi:predicted pyridoxine 5'-phosphate oxidase superfamily flavin-nucleotide-binding protein